MEICNNDSDNLISHEDALKELFKSSNSIKVKEDIELSDSIGRVLYEDILSPINVPPFDNSAMDGYAINLADELQNVPGIKKFPIVSRVIAGDIADTLNENDACRIFTGAMIPAGANTIVKQEDCDEIENGFVEVYTIIRLGSNIRPKAQDIKKDDLIIKKGTKITPLNIGIIASIGISTVVVYKKLNVGLFFTGNELTLPGDILLPGKIYNSNQFSIASILTSLNCNLVNIGIIPDSLETTKESLVQLSEKCDMILTTGGVSVGDEDYVKQAVEELGKINLWKIRTKPGKPIAFGEINNALFLGLPGNPVSSIVTLMMYGIPCIKKMQGISNYRNTPTQIKANFTRKEVESRREFVRVSVNDDGLEPKLDLYQNQGSNILSSISESTGLAELFEHTKYNHNDMITYYGYQQILS